MRQGWAPCWDPSWELQQPRCGGECPKPDQPCFTFTESLVALVDPCQQGGVCSASSRESLSFGILNNKDGEVKVASGTVQQNKQASKFWQIISGHNLITSK